MSLDLALVESSGTYRLLQQYTGETVAEGAEAGPLLRRAVDDLHAAGGGELALGSGTFSLTEPLALRSDVVVRGKGPGTRFQAAGDLPAVFQIEQADRAQVRDVIIDGGAIGVDIANSGEVKVFDVEVRSAAAHGFRLRDNAFLCELRGCRAMGCAETGFLLTELKEGGRIGSFVPNLLTGCVVSGGGVGFGIYHALVLNLVGCQVFQTAGHGFYLTYESNSVALTGCRTFQVGGDAYRAEQANELSLTGNVFCWHRGDGIHLRKVTWGAITGNEIIDNGVRTADGSLRRGIVLAEGSRGLQVSGNAIFNWADQCPMQVGIEEDESCQGNNLSANNINYYRRAGLIAKGQDTVAAANRETGSWFMWDPGKPHPDFNREKLTAYLGQG